MAVKWVLPVEMEKRLFKLIWGTAAGLGILWHRTQGDKPFYGFALLFGHTTVPI
jgi:hypothetical protein